ncbi:hypothetical protein F4808DRAFT_458520 [Astrocystis sublimbata]|nr:hypothetical protein F4808DRAFT_458520 [Astrocystis sublimbata]
MVVRSAYAIVIHTSRLSVSTKFIAKQPKNHFSQSLPKAPSSGKQQEASTSPKSTDPQSQGEKRKTQAQLDEELRLKMSGIAGDGGAAGVEYEDGQPVAMKRSVKNNMFRYI